MNQHSRIAACVLWLAVLLLLILGTPLFLCMQIWCVVTHYDMAARNLLDGGVHYRDIFDTNLPGMGGTSSMSCPGGSSLSAHETAAFRFAMPASWSQIPLFTFSPSEYHATLDSMDRLFGSVRPPIVAAWMDGRTRNREPSRSALRPSPHWHWEVARDSTSGAPMSGPALGQVILPMERAFVLAWSAVVLRQLT